MKVNDIIHGFKIERVRKSDELGGTLYEMRHIKTGAALAFLDNQEDNMLFSVAFKTLPWDDTGVFHILEHSVLAGSENYPVKEPFLDLLKSSMNTFLNAMTFPDKTMYPVSSRNEQDFINLTRVYLDAVFRPAIYTNESIFRQEGWHYEVEDGKPFYNGVVFNEMKGALGSVDGLAERLINKYLFPNSIYGFESGGDPQVIPDLTYENFLRAHRDFYSPTNAKIYLDGAIPLDTVLKLIDGEYLSHFEYNDKPHEIVYQKPIDAIEVTQTYEIGKEESEQNKTQLIFAKVFASWEERKRCMAYMLMTKYLADSNESPLKRAILEKGLAQDVEFNVVDGIAQPYYILQFRNTNQQQKEEINNTYREVLEKIKANGIDKEELTACLNKLEFTMREPEEPKGLYRNIFALNSWLYGGDMLLYLENNAVLAELRDAVSSDYYETILNELLDASHMLTLTMLPSKTKGEELKAAEEQRVNAEYSAMSDEQKVAVARTYETMRCWQDTPDSPEAVATLPVLSVSDVNPKPMWVDTEEFNVNGIPFLYHKLDTNGIVHCNLYFDISDEKTENVPAISFLTNLLSVLPTKQHSPAELQKEIKKSIGFLDFNVQSIGDKEAPLLSDFYFVVTFSVLEKNLDAALTLVREILLETEFNYKDIINENLLQTSEALYQGALSAGHSLGILRVLSGASAASCLKDKSIGYGVMQYLNDFSKHFEERAAAYIAYLEARTKEVFTKARLTVSETADSRHNIAGPLTEALAQGEKAGNRFAIELQPPVKEAILIPSGVSYAVYGNNISWLGAAYSGILTVTALLLTYGYLWNEIRVHGGAYGCGFRAAQNGSVSFHSYRDPNPLNSVEVYKNTADFIREFVRSDESVEKYIISSIAATEGLKSTLASGTYADLDYMQGYTYEDKCRTRQEMLSAKKEDLLALCPLFDKMKKSNSVCIVGNENALSSLDDSWNVVRL